MPSARRRLAVSLLVGLVASGATSWRAAWEISVLIGWCGVAGVFAVSAWTTMLKADSERTRAIATREDDTRVAADLVVLVAGTISLVGVGFILLKASAAEGLAVVGMTSLGVLSVLLAWTLVHTVYTLRYAHVYYSDGEGIDFNQDDDPDFHDFAYLAFTIGMTYQVSDTDLKTKKIRRTALKHMLLSYLFGTAIIAVTINIVAGLAH